MAGFSKKDEAFRAYAVSAPPPRVLLAVGGPLALHQALQAIFKLLDAMMASHISADAVSAVSCLSQITLMVTALGSGLAVGGSIKISEAYGQGDSELVRRQVASVYALAVIASALVAVTLIPFAAPFLRLLQTPQELIEAGVGYFRMEVLGLVLRFFNTVYIAIERSRGRAKKILLLNLAATLVKLGLSALFVYRLGGGVVMLSAATLASELTLLLYAGVSMVQDEGAFRFSPRQICLRKKLVGPVLRLAYPVTAEKLLFHAGKVAVNAMSGLYGGLTVGALGISNNIGGLTTGWQSGMLDAASGIISQNRGAGKHRRALRLYGWLLAIDIAIGAAGLLLVSQTLPALAGIFAQSKSQFDPAFRDLIVSIHRWEMLGYITLGINSATAALLLGYGRSKWTLFLNATRVLLYRVPALWVLQRFTSLGAEAVGVTMMVSNIATGVTAVALAVPMVLRIRRLAAEEE